MWRGCEGGSSEGEGGGGEAEAEGGGGGEAEPDGGGGGGEGAGGRGGEGEGESDGDGDAGVAGVLQGCRRCCRGECRCCGGESTSPLVDVCVAEQSPWQLLMTIARICAWRPQPTRAVRTQGECVGRGTGEL